MGKYYIDCEFDGHNGPLLSMAIIRSARDSVMIVTGDTASDPWVTENVIPVMHVDTAQETVFTSISGAGWFIREFLADDLQPVIIADSPVDIARFCQAISTDDNGGWACTDFSRMTFEVHNVDCYPTTLPGAIQHNAWWDAMALRHALTVRKGDCPSSPDGRHQVDTSMESGPNNCFHCEVSMRKPLP